MVLNPTQELVPTGTEQACWSQLSMTKVLLHLDQSAIVNG